MNTFLYIFKKYEKYKKIKNDKEWLEIVNNEAIHSFFLNSGLYLLIWENKAIEISLIRMILEKSESNSNLVRLFIFDGFSFSDDRNMKLTHINLPVGELNIYSKGDLEELLLIQQNEWHHNLTIDNLHEITQCHVLKVSEEENYRGPGTLHIGSKINFDTCEFVDYKRWSDINFIGPIFLFVGNDCNLGEEIKIRTNLFDRFPVTKIIKNNYITRTEWGFDHGSGEPFEYKPITTVNAGKEGVLLRKIYEAWSTVNNLHKDGFIRFPTECYVRAIMNLHKDDEGYLENFVNFVTVIESLLNPDGKSELTYKTAMRAACLISKDPKKRFEIFEILKKIYDARSKIVHQGHPAKHDLELYLKNIKKLTNTIFIKYLAIIHVLLRNDIKNWIKEKIIQKPNANISKPDKSIIENIFDALILDSDIQESIEEVIQDWGIKLLPIL